MKPLNERIGLLKHLGKIFRDLSSATPGYFTTEYAALESSLPQIELSNPWFTRESVLFSIDTWGKTLTEEKILNWASHYDLPDTGSKTREVLVIMAGNIPLVGFHDFISVILSGHKFLGKMSSKDNILFPLITKWIFEFDPGWKDYINLMSEISSEPGILIATGSNNTSALLKERYRHVPSIIRHNRNSLGLLTGNETKEDLASLSRDILQYFGLGCRNVSLLMIPDGMNTDRLLSAINNHEVKMPQPYLNNLRYQKAKAVLNKTRFIDAGKLIILFHESLHSPLAALNIQEYKNISSVKDFISIYRENIQCMVGNSTEIDNMIPFGESQHPELYDYADGLDTVKFLLENK